MSQTKILIVDDDAKVRTLLRRCLEGEGFIVAEAGNAAEAERVMRDTPFDLITMDLSLGEDSGLEIVRDIRRDSGVPIIIVSAKTDLIDKVVGLEVGADDFITKPFHVREVAARARAVLRRSRTTPTAPEPAATPSRVPREEPRDGKCYEFEGFKAWIDRFELYDPTGEMVELTSGDFRLLRVFLEHPGRILSRERIMDLLNGNGWTPLDRTIDNQVARLRKKIEAEPSKPRFIKTVRAVGYTFSAAVRSC